MRLTNGVQAVKSMDKHSEGVWSFRFVGNGALQCLNEAYMEEMGTGINKRVVLSIPHYSTTKNQVFPSIDQAFAFVNNFILRNK
jgi:hypothetical protein